MIDCMEKGIGACTCWVKSIVVLKYIPGIHLPGPCSHFSQEGYHGILAARNNVFGQIRGL